MSNQRKPTELEKFAVKHLLVGLENGPMDEILLEYLEGFCQTYPVDFASFIHVMKNALPTNSDDLDFDVEELHQSEKETVTNQLRSLVQGHLGKCMEGKVSVWADWGEPLEVLLRNAQEMNSDLVAIGQKASARSHGITAKSFIRHVKSNALLVPEAARWKLQRILVPVDFSENSAKALKTALSLSHAIDPTPVLDVLHLYDLPTTTGTFRISETRLLEAIDADRKDSMKQFIAENVPADFKKHVRTIVKPCRHRSIGARIVDFAARRRDHLIVMGARGHSIIERLLMGSVTEKVLTLTTKIPVLVIR